MRLYVNYNLFMDIVEGISSSTDAVGHGYKLLCPKCHAVVNTNKKSLNEWLVSKIRYKHRLSRLRLPCKCNIKVSDLYDATYVDEWLADIYSKFLYKGYKIIEARAPHNDNMPGFIRFETTQTMKEYLVKYRGYELRLLDLEEWRYDPKEYKGEEPPFPKGDIYKYYRGKKSWKLEPKRYFIEKDPNTYESTLLLRTNKTMADMSPLERFNTFINDMTDIAYYIPANRD